MYLMNYRQLKIINQSTLLLEKANGREHKTNINNVIPVSTLEAIENAWDSFLHSIKTSHQNHDYNLRPHN